VENGVAKAVPVKRGIASDQYVGDHRRGLRRGAGRPPELQGHQQELEDGAKVKIEEAKNRAQGLRKRHPDSALSHRNGERHDGKHHRVQEHRQDGTTWGVRNRSWRSAGVSVNIAKNEYVAIMGPSGFRQIHADDIIGCLGHADLRPVPVQRPQRDEMNDNELAKIRNREIGFVFQTFNLLARSDSLHNVELPLIYAGVPSAERKRRATETLQHVQLGDRIHQQTERALGGTSGNAWRSRAPRDKTLDHTCR